MINVLSFKQYLIRLNEGLLKSFNIDTTVSMVGSLLTKAKVEYSIVKKEHSFQVTLENFNYISNISVILNTLEQYITNNYGYFANEVEINNIYDKSHKMKYELGKELMLNRTSFIDSIIIEFESKFSETIDVPNFLYHLTIKQYQQSILKNGLIPKDKSKLKNHPARIYVTSNLDHCLSLIPAMNLVYSQEKLNSPKSLKNYESVIFKIDTKNLNIKLYQDPNYLYGYYTTSNISPDHLSIEKLN